MVNKYLFFTVHFIWTDNLCPKRVADITLVYDGAKVTAC